MDAAVNLGHNSHFALSVIHQQVLNWHGIMVKSTVLGGLMMLSVVLLNEKFILIFQHKNLIKDAHHFAVYVKTVCNINVYYH